MSWKATAWAKETRGHKGLASKVLLLVLADYYDDERGYAWPSQRRLADDCEMGIRTVQHVLAWLEKEGFLTTLQQGNQHQPSKYKLNFSIAHSQSYVPANHVPATFAGTPVPANHDNVYPQTTTCVPAIHVHTSLHEPPIREEKKEPLSTEVRKRTPVLSLVEEDKSVWPDWYATLYAIPGFKRPFKEAEAWRVAKSISEEHAEITAYALKGKWTAKQYPDAWATFQNWCKRPAFTNAKPTNGGQNVNGAKGTPEGLAQLAKFGSAGKTQGHVAKRRDASGWSPVYRS